MKALVLCLLPSLLGATVGATATPGQLCDPQNAVTCNCSYLKNYDAPLNISCVDSTNNCTWYHTINGMRMPIEEKFRTTNKKTITLLGYFDNLSYGTFTATNSTNHSCYYLVAPPQLDGDCHNCTGIKINGTLRSNNETLCTLPGDNITIQADVPLISSQYSFVLRLNNRNCPTNCERSHNLTYNCNSLTANNTGLYCIHVSLTFGESNNPEWQSNNVTIIVQSITISFTQSTYSVNESAGRIQPVLYVSNPSLTNITVEVFTTNATAFGGNVDYGSGPYTVTIPAGNITSVSFEVKINDDNILEDNETFGLAINSSALPQCISLTGPYRTTVTIVDDDVAIVTFEKATYNVSENDTAQIVLILSKPSSANVSVEVFDANTTALGRDVDYISGPYNVVFSIGQTRASLHFEIHNDSILENNETLTLIISNSSLPGNVIVGDPGNTTVTIVDDDVATVNFEEETYCVTKNDRQVQPALTLSNPSSININVTVKVWTTFGQYRNSEPFNVTFPAGDSCVQFDVPIKDSMSEDNETNNFTLIINPSSLPSNIIVSDPSQATVIIRDNCIDNIPSDDDNDTNAGIIAGATIGGIALLAGIVLVVGAIIWRYRKYHHKDTPAKDE